MTQTSTHFVIYEPRATNGALTIEYKNADDLLRKLRAVPTGQSIQLKDTGGNQMVATEIRCDDHEAEVREQKRLANLSAAINAEMQRIHLQN